MKWELFGWMKFEYHRLIFCFCVTFYTDVTPYPVEDNIIVVITEIILFM